ncbi:MAG: N-acetylmuramoyl-L-alanine amidase [Bacteroidales bacterium]|nr:N-acetylmuramoyl-L-alanine amidase [Bacteroidales bacterium]
MRSLRKCIPAFCLLVFAMILPYSQNYAQDQNMAGIRKVVIDAGHGGKDPGASGSRSKEKDIVLSVALKLGSYIQKNSPDIEVVYTRKKDVFVELSKRAEIANNANADVFISIHANSIATSKNAVRGTETYVLGVAKTDTNMEVAQRENSVILLEEGYNTRYEGFDPKSAESYIMFSLMQNAYFNQSIQLAESVQNMFKTATPLSDRGVKQLGLLVLARTSMPAILVEIGYISNATEEKYLMSEIGQIKIAAAIYNAFAQYRKSVEERTPLSKSNIKTTSEPVKVADNISEKVPEQITNQAKEQEAEKQIEKISDSDTWLYVQVLASKSPIPAGSSNFKKVKDIVTITSSDYYRYGVLKTRDMAEAEKKLKEIRSLFPDAFITAASNGKIIPVQQALNQIKR